VVLVLVLLLPSEPPVLFCFMTFEAILGLIMQRIRLV
jgi:hypothetical protein